MTQGLGRGSVAVWMLGGTIPLAMDGLTAFSGNEAHAIRLRRGFRGRVGNSYNFMVNWAGRYESPISSSTWEVPHDKRPMLIGHSNDDHRAAVRFTPREAKKYRLVNKVTLADGTVDERSISVLVRPRGVMDYGQLI